MKVFITCINGLVGTAKDAQDMVSDIAHELGFRNMGIFFYNAREESVGSLSARSAIMRVSTSSEGSS